MQTIVWSLGVWAGLGGRNNEPNRVLTSSLKGDLGETGLSCLNLPHKAKVTLKAFRATSTNRRSENAGPKSTVKAGFDQACQNVIEASMQTVHMM